MGWQDGPGGMHLPPNWNDPNGKWGNAQRLVNTTFNIELSIY